MNNQGEFYSKLIQDKLLQDYVNFVNRRENLDDTNDKFFKKYKEEEPNGNNE
jgi:hypothetical protein